MAEGSAKKKRRSPLATLLRAVTAFSARHSRVSLWLILVLSCAGIGITVAQIRFKTDRADLIDPAAAFSQEWQEYRDSFGNTSDLVVVIKSEDSRPEWIRSVMNRIGDDVSRDTENFSDVLYRVDRSKMLSKGLQYLTPGELRSASRRVTAYQPVLRQNRWELIRLEEVAANLRRQIQAAQAGEQGDPDVLYTHAERFAGSLNQFLQNSRDGFTYGENLFRSPWPQMMPIGADLGTDAREDVVYTINDAGTLGFLKVFPVEHDQDLNSNARSIARLREYIAAVQTELNQEGQPITVQLTGIPVLEYDEMQRSGTDMLHAGLIAFVAVGVLLLLGFRGVRHPMLALLMLVVALSWTFGLATLLIGHLNIISVSFAVILIGLGIDFSIHFLSGYLQQRQNGREMHQALENAAGTIGTGIVTSALTTALAFFSAVLTGFPGLAELGIIAGGGILLCALATFTVLPPLIVLSDESIPLERLPKPMPAGALHKALSAAPLVVLLFSAAAAIGIGSQAFRYADNTLSCRVEFDSNLINLHARNAESVSSQRELFAATNQSLLYAISVADSWESAIDLKHKFLELPSVDRVEELASQLPQFPTAEQRQLIGQLRSELKDLPASYPSLSVSRPERIGKELEALYQSLRTSPDRSARIAGAELNEFLDGFAALNSSRKQTAFLDAYQNLLMSSLLTEFRTVSRATSLEEVTLRDLPASLTRRFIRTEGEGESERQKWLLQVYAKDQLWNEQPLTTFVSELRTVDPNVTGTPIHNYESAVRLRASYQTIGLYSIGVIALILLMDFLRPGQKLLTLIPPIAIVAFIGYTTFQRHGELNLHFLVCVYLGMVTFIAVVLDFRNLRDTLLALFPALVGSVMLLGLMAVMGIHLNPLNIIVLPLVLGIGVDDGIHIVHDYRRQVALGKTSYVISPGVITGVLLTSLTSMIGFGSLMISAHQGLFSVGMVLMMGVGSCLFLALIPLPALLSLVARYHPAPMEAIPSKPVANSTAAGGSPSAQDENSQQKNKSKGQQQQHQQRRAA